MEQHKVIYRFAGPPEIRLESWPASDHGQTWLQHALIASPGADGVVVIASRPDGTILFGQHFRPVIGATCLELPRGFGAPGATPEEDGARELLEETGLVSRSARVIGRFYPDSGLLSTRIAVIQCEVDTEDQPHISDGELRDFVWCSPSRVESMIGDGAIADGISISAFAIWSSGPSISETA